MIGLGLLLQRKISSSDQLNGIKVLILCVALPATIFIALLKVELSGMMLVLPLLALVINLVLLVAFTLSSKALGNFTKGRKRTLILLLPSLAPGLSCFPFISEYLGDESLALVAVADVGNKFFVLILLYLLAMHWYYKYERNSANSNSKLKDMVIALISEPINLVMIVALALLSLGVNLSSIPESLSSVILRLSSIMAPLILLFIGLAVRISRNDISIILRLLSWRSGLMFIISGLILLFMPDLAIPTALLIIVFPQSSCSFWPFAHMNTIAALEDRNDDRRTFDVNFGLSVLACSLPFSTILILGAFSFQTVITIPLYTILLGCLLLGTSYAPLFIQSVRRLFITDTAISVTTDKNSRAIKREKVLADAG